MKVYAAQNKALFSFGGGGRLLLYSCMSHEPSCTPLLQCLSQAAYWEPTQKVSQARHGQHGDSVATLHWSRRLQPGPASQAAAGVMPRRLSAAEVTAQRCHAAPLRSSSTSTLGREKRAMASSTSSRRCSRPCLYAFWLKVTMRNGSPCSATACEVLAPCHCQNMRLACVRCPSCGPSEIALLQALLVRLLAEGHDAQRQPLHHKRGRVAF